MTKLYYTLTLVCTSAILHAQIKKDAVLLGGQIYYNHVKLTTTGYEDVKSNEAYFAISAGKAVKDNTVYGINFSYSPYSIPYITSGNTIDFTAKGNNYTIGVFYRQYRTLAKDLYFFTEVGAAYITYKETDRDSTGITVGKATQKGGQLTLMPGITYKLFNKFYLEVLIPNIVTIQYADTKITQQAAPNSKQSQFVFNTSLNGNSLDLFGVGFRFIL